MLGFAKSGRVVVIPKKKLAGEGTVSHAFQTKIKGKILKGLVVKKNDRYYAYHNLCKHLPVTLDLNDGGFFTHDKSHLQCHMHGAMYEVETGFCVAGPCQGARLSTLLLQEDESQLVITFPPEIGE